MGSMVEEVKERVEASEFSRILENYRTVAVVGLSRNPGKDSHRVARYLKEKGYRIIPINPYTDEVLGERCYKNLLEMPEDVQRRIEIIDIFRPTEDVPPIVEEAVQLRERHGSPHVIWMQLGIVNEEAAKRAKRAGIAVVMDRCIMIEHRRLFQV